MTAQSLHDFLIVVEAHLHLHNLVGGGFLYFLTHFLRIGIVADGEGCVGTIVGIQAPYLVPWLAHDLACKVVQRDIDRRLGGTVIGSDLLHVFMYVLNAERI